MDEDSRDGAVAGLGSIFVSVLFATMYFTSSPDNILILVIAVFLGLIGLGALAKPDTIGPVVDEFLRRISEDGEELNSEESQNVTVMGDNHGNIANNSKSKNDQSDF
ncbi:hypothetical protein [Candidatus Nanohalobium constans]|uniref:Uncharacterized protein n=1 Tax=Candidatus Nanohalobium constans TaxID=2565781 RepID=A0A5Q0UHF5_9ARCH|nr:hypothetical protein [Candidatus Nanohalobium constans]QGA80640.1 hypothetical protein LC1Nh_0755 [Candidatus Nanohalobium constans]